MNWIDVCQTAVLGFLLWKGVRNEIRVDKLESEKKDAYEASKEELRTQMQNVLETLLLTTDMDEKYVLNQVYIGMQQAIGKMP